MALKSYKTYSVKELCKVLKDYAKELPKGEDSPVFSGDFEGNCTHIFHDIMLDEENGAVFLGYEMHEDMGELTYDSRIR